MTIILCVYLFGMIWFFIIVAFPIYLSVEDNMRGNLGNLTFLVLVLLWPIVLVSGICNYLIGRREK